MERWEYKAVWYDGPNQYWHKDDAKLRAESRKSFETFINQYGAEGWQLISDSIRCMIFARRVP